MAPVRSATIRRGRLSMKRRFVVAALNASRRNAGSVNNPFASRDRQIAQVRRPRRQTNRAVLAAAHLVDHRIEPEQANQPQPAIRPSQLGVTRPPPVLSAKVRPGLRERA